MTRKPLVIAALGVGLLLSSLLVHRAGRREDPRPRRTAPAPELPTEIVTAAPVPEPPPDYWSGLSLLLDRKAEIDRPSHQDRVFERTIQHLELVGPQAAEFREAAALVVREIRRAWEVREAAMSGPLEGLEASQEVYEEAKRRAVGLLEAFLRERAADPVFLGRIDEWIDVVR